MDYADNYSYSQLINLPRDHPGGGCCIAEVRYLFPLSTFKRDRWESFQRPVLNHSERRATDGLKLPGGNADSKIKRTIYGVRYSFVTVESNT